jgi:hypothetical protein
VQQEAADEVNRLLMGFLQTLETRGRHDFFLSS